MVAWLAALKGRSKLIIPSPHNWRWELRCPGELTRRSSTNPGEQSHRPLAGNCLILMWLRSNSPILTFLLTGLMQIVSVKTQQSQNTHELTRTSTNTGGTNTTAHLQGVPIGNCLIRCGCRLILTFLLRGLMRIISAKAQQAQNTHLLAEDWVWLITSSKVDIFPAESCMLIVCFCGKVEPALLSFQIQCGTWVDRSLLLKYWNTPILCWHTVFLQFTGKLRHSIWNTDAFTGESGPALRFSRP